MIPVVKVCPERCRQLTSVTPQMLLTAFDPCSIRLAKASRLMSNVSVTVHDSPASKAAYQSQYESPAGTYAITAPRPVALPSPLYQTSADFGATVATVRLSATRLGIRLWIGSPQSISS